MTSSVMTTNSEHRPCQEWYCDPEKVSDPSLIKQLLEEGPHCEACGNNWPCAVSGERTNQGEA